MRDFDIVVLGEVNVDLILGPEAQPVFGQVETVVEDATLTIGGSGTIFACGAARLDLRVGYCGVVGDDFFGRFMLESLQARNVDTRAIVVDPALKTGLSVILNVPGDRAILTHLGAIDALDARQVDRSLLARTRHVHVTSYFLQHSLRPGLAPLLAEARAGGATVSLDTNWDPSEEWDHGLWQVLQQTDVFLPNEQEALAIAGCDHLDAALDRLGAVVPTVVVKRGADGAICRHDGRTVSDPGFRLDEGDVVDTTGAGDSFNAGFLYGFLNGWEIEHSLALACACGALSTRAAGGTTAQPTLPEAQGLIQQRA